MVETKNKPDSLFDNTPVVEQCKAPKRAKSGRLSIKHDLPCCALCNITAGNGTPIEDLRGQIKKLQDEAKEWWNVGDRRSGQTAVFTIVTPNEEILEQNLITLGFKNVAEFSRRNGYEQNGQLKMYFLDVLKAKV